MHRRTKIICTMGPAVNSREAITRLLDAGMNVARLNFSHGTHEDHGRVIRDLKSVRSERRVPLAIMLDTKGPEIRVGSTWKERTFRAGNRVSLVASGEEGIPVKPAIVLEFLKPGMQVLFDDGYLTASVIGPSGTGIEIEFSNEGVLKPSKSMNLPGARVPLPALTTQDEEDLRFGVQQGVDLVAASFVRSAAHVLAIRDLLTRLGAPDIQIIAKIENAEGIQNFDEIVQAADGIMVARGDLGVELPVAQVPRLQKMMIRKCFQAGKPVVTATQMLESMIVHSRPTRAEVSDVANAIYDSTSAVMLSGETAMGAHPIEAVEVMRAVIEETERDVNYRDISLALSLHQDHEIPSAVALAAVRTAHASGARAIFAFTKTGGTARLLSRLRPSMPVLAFVPEERRFHQMSLLWGVMPFLAGGEKELGPAFQSACHQALDRRVVHSGDSVVVTAGAPFGIAGTTNSMIVESIGKVLIRGKGIGHTVHGRLVEPGSEIARCNDQILWVHEFSNELATIAAGCRGVLYTSLLTDHRQERAWMEWGQLHHRSVVCRSGAPDPEIPSDAVVTLDPKRGLVLPGEGSI
jgi:pyruvate kinase